MTADDLIKVIAALGVGSGASAVITAVVASNSQRGKSRAEAADLLIGAAERIGKINQEQDSAIRELKVKLELMHVAALDFLAGKLNRDEFIEALRELR